MRDLEKQLNRSALTRIGVGAVGGALAGGAVDYALHKYELLNEWGFDEFALVVVMMLVGVILGTRSHLQNTQRITNNLYK